MKIYTKTGDTGETSLYNGTRVSKADILIDVLGDSDELSSYLGLVHDLVEDKNSKNQISEIINTLFRLNASIAKAKGYETLNLTENINQLESFIDKMDLELPPLSSFIYLFGHPIISQIHIARSICRRLERKLVTAFQFESIEPTQQIYLNRLSDYLFVLARFTAKNLNVEETPYSF
ncbi:MAG: cob(I)yrinic acid a,c-diamide adenosyltransferase [Neisseriales bacterium]|nr:MAG: cob(I)yrinic acid a,c-diamide adenosyltransferase [Neisseriales bacterium]